MHLFFWKSPIKHSSKTVTQAKQFTWRLFLFKGSNFPTESIQYAKHCCFYRCVFFSPHYRYHCCEISVFLNTAHCSPDYVCQPPITETIVTNTASQIMHKIKYGYGHLNNKKKKYLSVHFSFRNYHPQRVQGMIKDRQGYLHHMKHLIPL